MQPVQKARTATRAHQQSMQMPCRWMGRAVSSADKQDTTQENARRLEERRKAKEKGISSNSSKDGRQGNLQAAREEAKR